MSTLLATADSNTLMCRAQEMIDAGRLGAARALVAALRRLAPDPARFGSVAARLAMREGRFDQAGIELDAAIAVAPQDGGLRKQRAELRLQGEDLVGAASDAADAVIFDRRDVDAKALLGLVLVELGQHEDAASCLSEAVAEVPDRVPFRLGLSQAQNRGGAPDEAEATLRAGIARGKVGPGLHAALILHLLRLGRCADAVDAAEAARRTGAVDAVVFGLLGHALSSLGRHLEASDAYREALKLSPEDPYVRHLVAASGALPSEARAPSDYLRVVFDGYAERFEAHLMALGYRVPGLIRREIERLGSPPGTVLDLGCGTGLMAVALSDLGFGPFTGVDLSPRMLAHAGQKGLYASLAEDDLSSFLDAADEVWPLVLAADVLCYFGELTDILARIAPRLAPGGRLIFSVEEVPDDAEEVSGWRLGRLARFAHTATHVADAAGAAGLRVLRLQREMLRMEAEAPVGGMIVTLERA